MVEEVIKLRPDFDEANKQVKKVGQGVDELKQKANQAEKETKKIAAGFKAIGTAIKAAGIGLVIAAFAKLSEAFMRNQKIADTLSNAMNTVSIIFTQVLDVFTNVITKVGESSNGFSGLSKVVSGLITISLTPLKLAFHGIMLAVDQARLAWEESFFGDKDPETIKMLKTRISETQKSIVEVGEKAIQSGKDVVNNFGKAISEIGQVVNATIDGVSEINIEAAKEQGKALTEARKNAELAQVRLQGLIEKYDRLAEAQRQIRDDERLSIDERIAANDALGVILEKQLQAQLDLANQRVNAAQLEIKATGNNIENQKALQEALNEVAAVEAQITGFKSEQRINEAALQKERKENLNEIAKINRDEVELQKIEAQQLYEQQVELINKTISSEEERNAALEQARQAHIKTLAEIEKKAADEQAEKDKKAAEDKIALERKVADAKLAVTMSVLNAVADLFGRESAAGKAAAVAMATINTYQAATNALANTPLPAPFPQIAAAATIASGLAQVRGILKTQIPNSFGGSGVGGSFSTPSFQAPSVTIPGQSGINSIASAIQGSNQAIRAYVVTGDVTSGQELERKRLSNATFG